MQLMVDGPLPTLQLEHNQWDISIRTEYTGPVVRVCCDYANGPSWECHRRHGVNGKPVICVLCPIGHS